MVPTLGAGAHLGRPTSGEGGGGAPPRRPPPGPALCSHPCTWADPFPRACGGWNGSQSHGGSGKFLRESWKRPPHPRCFLSLKPWNRAGWAWNRDKERKREGEEHAPLSALVRAAPPTLTVPSRGRAGRTRPDGRDGACGPRAVLGGGPVPCLSGLGRGHLRVAFSQHLVHRYGERGLWCGGTAGGHYRRGMDGVLHRRAGWRAGEGESRD